MGTAERSAKTERPEAARAPSGPRAHLDYIDGLRGLAILSVLLYHFWQEARCPLAYWWNPLASGYDGVNLFLVVSGFCLYWPLVRPGRAGREPSLAEFARRRAHRLLPPYYAAVAIFTLAALGARALGLPWSEAPEGGPAATLTAAVWHFALVHNLRPQQIWTLDGPLWTVALEASLYVALPILVVVARKTRIEWAVALAAVVTLTYRVAVDRFAAGAGGWETIGANYTFVLADFLPGRWLEFALGMWAAALVGGGALSGRAPFGLLALACFIPNLWLRERFGQHNPVSEPLFGLCFFFLILSAARRGVGAGGPRPARAPPGPARGHLVQRLSRPLSGAEGARRPESTPNAGPGRHRPVFVRLPAGHPRRLLRLLPAGGAPVPERGEAGLNLLPLVNQANPALWVC